MYRVDCNMQNAYEITQIRAFQVIQAVENN